MVLTISGAYMSTCARRVLVTAYEFGGKEGEAWTFQPVEFGAIKSAEWMAKQPFGQMPIAEDGDFTLFESRAIARYIVAEAGKLPTNVKQLAKIDEAISVEQSNFDKYAAELAWEQTFTVMYGNKTDEARVAVLKQGLAKRLEGYEALLSKQKYMAGNEMTFVDLFYLPYGQMAAESGAAPGLVDGSLPNLARWWKEISSLESWKKANSHL